MKQNYIAIYIDIELLSSPTIFFHHNNQVRELKLPSDLSWIFRSLSGSLEGAGLSFACSSVWLLPSAPTPTPIIIFSGIRKSGLVITLPMPWLRPTRRAPSCSSDAERPEAPAEGAALAPSEDSSSSSSSSSSSQSVPRSGALRPSRSPRGNWGERWGSMRALSSRPSLLRRENSGVQRFQFSQDRPAGDLSDSCSCSTTSALSWTGARDGPRLRKNENAWTGSEFLSSDSKFSLLTKGGTSEGGASSGLESNDRESEAELTVEFDSWLERREKSRDSRRLVVRLPSESPPFWAGSGVGAGLEEGGLELQPVMGV